MELGQFVVCYHILDWFLTQDLGMGPSSVLGSGLVLAQELEH